MPFWKMWRNLWRGVAEVIYWTELKHGKVCGECGHKGKLYWRKLNAGMALAVIYLFRRKRWVKYSDLERAIGPVGRDYPYLVHWGLIKYNKHRLGYWRITAKGRRFAQGFIDVPRAALVFNNKLIDYDPKQITNVVLALRDKFDLWELLYR
jgi:hypothetical protein